ncbi:MAG TPA: J domain-containing protein [Sphingomicrobium sp.]|jgi:curved DNA-binding protein CbpA
MAGDGSAYAALGLEPGADSTTIEQAYRKLVKEHHPDRQRGSSKRAAEIIEAYRELRAIG